MTNCGATGKVRLPSRQAAKQFGRYVCRRIGQRMSVYQCQHCSAWHITKKNGYRSKGNN